MPKVISARQAMSDFRVLPSELWARAKQRLEVIAIIRLVKGYSIYKLA